MPGPLYVRNAVDTWTDESRPTKVIKQASTFVTQTAGGSDRFGWLYFSIPFPRGAKIIDARLHLYNLTVMAGSHTITVRRASAKYSVNRITHANRPGVTGSTATLNRPSAPVGSLWDVDVTALMQEVSNGAPWYGFRVSEGSSAVLRWYATDAVTGPRRPALVITWSMAPDEPDLLTPSDGLAVDTDFPVLTYDFSDPTGEGDLAAQQVQTSATEAALLAGTPDWDSGEVATTLPQYDTSSGSFPGVDVDEVVWWRVRVKDASGDWSDWSDPVEFTRKDLGVAAITTTNITEGSPTISMTYTGGGTPTAFRMMVSKGSEPDAIIHDSAMQDWDTNYNIPFGVVDDPDDSYVINVRIWDDIARVAIPGSPNYAEDSATLSVLFDVGVAAPTSVSVASDPMLPIGHLTWDHIGTATEFQILRSTDAGVTWTYIGEVDAIDAETGGSPGYEWDDTSPPAYQSVMWGVVAVIAGEQSSIVTDTASIRRLAPFLFRAGGINPVCFLNASFSMGFTDVHGLHEPLAGSAVLVTQKLGKKAGRCSGRLVDEVPIDGLDSKVMIDNFLIMRQYVGEVLFLARGDETLRVNAYNFSYDIVTDAGGVSYVASFDWIEVD